MYKACAIAPLLLVAAAAPAWAQNSQEILALDEPALIAILQDANAPTFNKAKACQRLAVVGTAASVPALADLLADETLNLYARFGLEGIADPAADAALREAAKQLRGRQLVGVLNSIGQRRDKQATELLRSKLKDLDADVAAAAVAALGALGTSEAAAALREAIAAAPTAPVAMACLACADRLTASGERETALQLYRAVRRSAAPDNLRADAARGLLRLAPPERARQLLVRLLQSDRELEFNTALAALRELEGNEVTATVVAELEKLPPPRRALALLALGDRPGGVPLPVVLSAAKSEYPAIREAAIRVLARLGDASAVSVLLDTALGDGPLALLARERLKMISGEGVDSAILERFATAEPSARVVLFDLAGGRGIAAAVPMAREELGAAEPEVRRAALGALGQLVSLDELDLLLDLALADPGQGEVEAARDALRTAALRVDDRDACATRLAARLDSVPAEKQAYLLDLIGQVGGPAALAVVATSASSPDAAIKDAATRVLGEWATPDVAAELLKIAKNDTEARYRVRALRGYLRVARQLQVTAEKRLEMFQTAMEIAERDEERQLALDVLTRIPSADSLALATTYLSQPALKQAAAQAALRIAPKLPKSDAAAVAQAMQQILAADVGEELAAQARQFLQQAEGGGAH